MAIHPATEDGSSRGVSTTALQPGGLPVTCSLTLAYASSLAIAVLVAIVSLAGLLYGPVVYPTEEMLLSKLPTDLFTLVVGLPLLLGSIWLAWRGKLLGVLLWPGALLYVLYIYLAYAIGVPFNILFLAYVVLAALSAYTTIGLVTSIDAETVRKRLDGAVPARLAGGILTGFAILFSMLNLVDVVSALTSPSQDHLLQLPVWIADFAVLAPAMLLGGLLLWQRRALGYVSGAGLLLVGCMLFGGAAFALAFPAFYTAFPVDVTGIVFILVVGLICLVPLVLFARGIGKSEHQSPRVDHVGRESHQDAADRRQKET